MRRPNGWKENQVIELSRRGEYIVIEPVFGFDETVDPETVVIHFHQSEYKKIHDFLDYWLALEKPQSEERGLGD